MSFGFEELNHQKYRKIYWNGITLSLLVYFSAYTAAVWMYLVYFMVCSIFWILNLGIQFSNWHGELLTSKSLDIGVLFVFSCIFAVSVLCFYVFWILLLINLNIFHTDFCTIVRYLMNPKMEFVKFFGKNYDVDSLAEGIIKEITTHKWGIV